MYVCMCVCVLLACVSHGSGRREVALGSSVLFTGIRGVLIAGNNSHSHLASEIGL